MEIHYKERYRDTIYVEPVFDFVTSAIDNMPGYLTDYRGLVDEGVDTEAVQTRQLKEAFAKLIDTLAQSRLLTAEQICNIVDNQCEVISLK